MPSPAPGNQPMFSMLVCSFLSLAPAAADSAKEPPPKKDLFVKEDWYKNSEGKEQEFTGTLKYAPRAKGVVGFGRFNPFTLEMVGKEGTREVYVGGKEELLKPYAGKRIKLIGKAVDMEVEGKQHKEIWPARLEVQSDEKSKTDPVPRRGIDDLKKKSEKQAIINDGTG